jgi:ribosomal protein S27AE
VRLSQNKGLVLDDMCGVIDSLKLTYNLSFTRENQGTIQISDKSFYEWLEDRIGQGCYNKNLPEEVFSWPKSARTNLFEALMLGDGTKSKLQGRTAQTYYTTSAQLAEDVQRLCLTLGYASHIVLTEQSKGSWNPSGSIYRVYISGTGEGGVRRLVNRDMITCEKYEKIIYCYNVPNHLFVTRRNSKITIQGNTTNRSTAQTMSRALVDSVKDIQDELEAQWDYEVINELLLESTFGEDILEESNRVHLKFAEIDIQNKMEQEKHASEMFKANGITWNEFRNELSREPIKVPEDPHDQDPAGYPEWFNTFWKLFDEPMALIKAVDEPYSVATSAIAESPSTSVTGVIQKAAENSRLAAEKKTAELDKQTKVAVAKANKPPANVKKDNFLGPALRNLEEESAQRLRRGILTRGSVDNDYMLSLGRVWAGEVSNKLQSVAVTEMIRGFNDHTGGRAFEAEMAIALGRKQIEARINFRLERLVEDTIHLIVRRLNSESQGTNLVGPQEELVQELHVAFDTLRYRTDFIWDMELRKAYSYGRILGVRYQKEYGVQLVAHPEACERCKSMDGKIIHAGAIDMEDLPPYHAASRMKFRILKESLELDLPARDAHFVPPRENDKPAVEQDNPALEEKTIVCPGCGNTAIWQERTNLFYCRKCHLASEKTNK